MYRFGSEDGSPMTIPVDPQLCFRWQLAAATQEHVESMCRTGYDYDTGRGVEQNEESALYWYTKAAEKGQKNAQHNLGAFYEFGRGQREIDLVQAIPTNYKP